MGVALTEGNERFEGDGHGECIQSMLVQRPGEKCLEVEPMVVWTLQSVEGSRRGRK